MNDEDLLEVVQKAAGDGTLRLAKPGERLLGGFWAELIAFRLAGWDHDLVARFMPDAATAAKETAVQAAVADLGFPTPAVRFAGTDDGTGRAFLVMDRVGGRHLLDGLGGVAAIRRLPSLLRTIPAVLGSTMARLHGVDPEPVRARLAEADVTAEDPVAMAQRLTDAAEALGRDDLRHAGNRLLAQPPDAGRRVVCHGDFHPFNVLVGEVGELAVLDWSGALLAPAEFDIAFTTLVLSEPPVAVPPAVRPLVRAAGRLLGRRFQRRYAREAGVTLDMSSLRWHEALLCLRSLVEVAGWVAGGTVEDHRGHPWLVTGPALAGRLEAFAGAPVRPA